LSRVPTSQTAVCTADLCLSALQRFAKPLRRFNHLRELIPNKEKLDKAAFLMSTMDYIKQLQVTSSLCVPGLQRLLHTMQSLLLLCKGLFCTAKPECL